MMAPGLPHFSGTEPTPRDEGTYDQWKYQGMRATCPDSAVRSALITSLCGEASELVGFVGFNAPMSVILEAIDKRFGKRATTDRLQQEFFQLQQEEEKEYSTSLAGWRDPSGSCKMHFRAATKKST